MMSSFYRAFEDRHRGARELIKGRQVVYLPFILPLKSIYQQCSALDLGCGRGEWLEILLENGFQPKGVDLDDGMLQECRVLNLPAEQGEALDTLRSLPDESQVVVSGFHIVEHIPFGNLQQLVSEALRVLKPAGLLILETPNAENLVVGTHSFYLDPTHERPIPHLLLSFLVDHAGFARSKLLRLQEEAGLAQADQLDLMSVLGGASPDYAIVAQKATVPEKMELFDQAFEKEYGLALDTLASRYDQAQRSKFLGVEEKLDCMSQQTKQLADQLRVQLQDAMQHVHHAEARCQTAESALREQIGRAAHAEGKQAATQELMDSLRKQEQQAEAKAVQAEIRVQQAEAKAEQAEVRAQQAEAKAEQAESRAQQAAAKVDEAQAEIQQAKAVTDQYSAHLQAVFASTSWQLTQPIRIAGMLLKGRWRAPEGGMLLAVKRRLKPLISHIVQMAARNPRIRRHAINYLARRPLLKARLKRIAWGRQHNDHSVNQLSAVSTPASATGEVEAFTPIQQGGRFKRNGVGGECKSPLESYYY